MNTYSFIRAQILEPKCLQCHSGPTPTGVDLSTYVGVRALIVPNSLGASRLFQVIALNIMPRGGPPLTAFEKQAIQLWILSGAPNN
jgi:hypothetical protein